MSHFVECAIREFSDSTVVKRQEKQNQLLELYANIDAHLAHIGGNLNQAMRRINEAAKAGIPLHNMLLDDLERKVMECYEVCNQLRKEMRDIIMKHA